MSLNDYTQHVTETEETFLFSVTLFFRRHTTLCFYSTTFEWKEIKNLFTAETQGDITHIKKSIVMLSEHHEYMTPGTFKWSPFFFFTFKV